jgi:hypothetical protein
VQTCIMAIKKTLWARRDGDCRGCQESTAYVRQVCLTWPPLEVRDKLTDTDMVVRDQLIGTDNTTGATSTEIERLTLRQCEFI